jgi:hypothetical protein
MIKSVRDVISTHILWSIYFAYCQSRLKYEIIFWGRDWENIKVFRLQEKVLD